MAEGELDAEMVAIAKAIIAQRTGSFDPTPSAIGRMEVESRLRSGYQASDFHH